MSLVEREAIVRQCQNETNANGLTVKQWCNEKGLSVKTYYKWKRRAGCGTNKVTEESASKQETVNRQKRQWAVLPAVNSSMEYSDVQNNISASYQITYSGYTVNLTNNIKTDTHTEILKAVKQACC